MEKINEIFTIAGKEVVVRYTRDGQPCEKCVLDGTKGCNSAKCSLLDRVGMEIDERAYFVPAEKDDKEFCKDNCKGYQETGRCFADGNCKAKQEAESKASVVSDADFEAEYKRYMESRKDDVSGHAVTVNIKDLARHFAEWGAEHLKR